MKFVKIHGAGNSYVYVKDCGLTDAEWGKIAKKVSDKRFGIASDGLIVVKEDFCYDAVIKIFNADGNRAQMCGNGIRGVAYLLSQKALKHVYEINTDCGVKTVETCIQKPYSGVYKVNMGKVKLKDLSLSQNGKGEVFVGGKIYQYTGVDVGNEHCVIFTENPQKLISKGKSFTCNLSFKNEVNAEFVKVVSPQKIIMYVYERGSGRTLACGTGACASVFAGIRLGLLKEGSVEVVAEGGRLMVSVEKEEVFLTGSAVKICSGEFEI